MEIYKNCFDNYEISNFGNVRRKLLGVGYKNIAGSLLKRGDGYKYFQVQREGKRINFLFHHLVAKYFIGERPEKMVIDHIDRNSLNNHIDNLRYCSQKENTQNTKKYRDDIIETDTIIRRNILSRERNRRNGRVKNIRKTKGSGCIQKRTENCWRATITIDKIKHMKHFKTKEEGEEYLNTFI